MFPTLQTAEHDICNHPQSDDGNGEHSQDTEKTPPTMGAENTTIEQDDTDLG